MIEHDQARVESEMAVGKLEVVDGAAGQARFDEILQVVSPVAEATAEREGHIHLVEQLEARQQRCEMLPRIAELLDDAAIGETRGAIRAGRAERQRRTSGDEGVARARHVERAGAQQHQARLMAQRRREGIGRMVRGSFFDDGAHPMSPTLAVADVASIPEPWPTWQARGAFSGQPLTVRLVVCIPMAE